MVTTGVLVLLVIGLINMPPHTDCRSDVPAHEKEHWFRATQTMVEPWRGPHHVYGIFVIPDQYKFDHLYTAKLTIQGAPVDFLAGSSEDGDHTEGGNYIKRVYLSTRTALWFLLTARFGELKKSCHWWLVLSDRSR
jgi:hypothetical protein